MSGVCIWVLPAAVRVALELRGIWLERPTPSTLAHWLDAFDSLEYAESIAYAQAVPR